MYKQIHEQTPIVLNGGEMKKKVSAVKAKKFLQLRLSISHEISSLIGTQIVKKPPPICCLIFLAF